MEYRRVHQYLGKRILIHGRLLSSMNLPRLHAEADIDHVLLGLSYGHEGCDPVIGADIDLTGTLVGRVFTPLFRRYDNWRWRRRTSEQIKETKTHD